MSSRIWRVLVLGLLLSCSGGGDGGPTGTPTPTPALTTVTVVLSASTIDVGQTATASATGTDQNGAAIGTGTVTWSTGSAATAIVSASGIVTGVAQGQTSVIASAGGKQGQQTITVTPLVTAGPATKLVVTTAPSASAPNQAAFLMQPVVQLQDANGNAVRQAGTVVTVALTAGGGTLGGAASATTTSSGAATFTNLSIAGTIGAKTLTFSAAGLTGATASVTLTTGAASAIAVVAGNNQIADAATAVSISPSVRVTDTNGNVVSGANITFAVASGGGTLTGANQTTDASGVATVGSWTLGSAGGANTITAVATGLAGSPLTFTATGIRLVPNNTASDSTTVGGSGAHVTLSTGTTATVVSTTASSSAVLRLTEVAGANPSAGNDTSRHFIASVTGGVNDSTVLRLSIVVSDPPASGQQQWLFVHSFSDPPGVGTWVPATSTSSSSLAARTTGIANGARLTGQAVYTFAGISISSNPVSIYPLHLDPTDPPSCVNIRRFAAPLSTPNVANPAFTVVLIHGWQGTLMCRGATVPGFGYYDDFYPEINWAPLADKIRARYPNANVYVVRYSTTAPPSAAGSYIIDQLTSLNAGGNTGPVILVGHSMGGLVARYAARGDRSATKIARIITLGTPHLGTPAADAGFGVESGLSRFLPSDGFWSLGSNVVNNDIGFPAPVPTYAIRGGVPCGSAGLQSVDLWLKPSWLYLCAAGLVSDGVVPSYSAIPPGVAEDYVAPYAEPGYTGVSHFKLTTDLFVGDKVVEWLAPYYSTPSLALSSTTVNFSATRGGANPAPSTVQLTNAGTGTLSGLSVWHIGYDYVSGQATGWLAASLNTTTATATLTLTPTVGTIAAGTYRAVVQVGSSLSWVTNSPQDVTVTLVVAEGSTPVATVTVAPATASIAVGATQQFTPTTKDASGNTLTGRTVTWTSGTQSVATVNSTTGVATGVAAGTAIITATSEGKTGSASLTSTGGGLTCTGAPTLGCGLALDQFSQIPAGSFQMGSNTYPGSNETPVHTVNITHSFYMQKSELTQGQWKSVMGSNPSGFSTCGDTCPVDTVSWDDIQTFLTTLNARTPGVTYRLPTEAEWEYAARAGTTGETYGTLDAIAWYSSNSDNKVHPAAGKQANAWGLYDMIGNVFEWVNDWWGPYTSASATNPTGPATGAYRVTMRGGSWAMASNYARAASRYFDSPSIRFGNGGFRLVRTP